VPRSLSERLVRVQKQLEDLSEVTRIEWLRAARKSFLTIEERNAFRVAFDASSGRFLELLEEKWAIEREIRAAELP